MQELVPERLLFVDRQVEDADLLLSSITPDIQLHMLSEAGDPLAEIAAVISCTPGLHQVTILAHGTPGALRLGGTIIDAANLEGASLDGTRCTSGALDVIRSILGPEGELTLIVCSVGTGHAGAHCAGALRAAIGTPVTTADADLGGGTGWHALPPALCHFTPAAPAVATGRTLGSPPP